MNAGRKSNRSFARIRPLAQRRARGQQLDAQRLLVERVAAEVLNRVEVRLALHQQAHVDAHGVAVLHPAAHCQRLVDLLEHRCQSLQVMAHQRKSRHRREVVIELLDDQCAHGGNSAGGN
jgi:plasmid replication initiation protein